MSAEPVLDEDQALELLAYLVTAARTQLDEAAEYGPLRLLTAASRLAEMIAPRASPETRALLTGPLQAIAGTATSSADPTGYAERVDELCRAVAGHLVRRFGARDEAG
jgi:hypothetical protein